MGKIIVVTLYTYQKKIYYHRDTTFLLDVLELHHIPLEYQCRSGYCGSCRIKLLKGKVAYEEQPLAFINDGEILPCYCMPLVDIELEI